MAKSSGYVGMFSPYVWMFIQSYEKLRKNIFDTKNITTLIQFEYSAFEEATVPVCSFVYRNKNMGEKGGYFRLVDFRGGMEVQRQKYLEAIENPNCGFFYTASTENFEKIPGCPVAYWVSEKLIDVFKEDPIEKSVLFRQGMATSDNNRFLRFWHEVDIADSMFDATDLQSAKESKKKWFAYNKGGAFRKWYGNIEYVVNWFDDGKEMKAFTATLTQGMNVRLKSREYYFKECYSWSKISSGSIAFRYYPTGFAFDVAGCCVFECPDLLYYNLGLSNSVVTKIIAEVLSPTMNYELDHLKKIPLIIAVSTKEMVDNLVQLNITNSKTDWDSFETSWNFKRHPLVGKVFMVSELSNLPTHLEDCFTEWKNHCETQFNQLKANEEELNRIFIDIYGLQDELTPEVQDKDVTVNRIFNSKEEIPESMKGSKYALTKQDVIKSFVSYAVGCMFGRYSLDVDGLAYAGGDWDNSKYRTFIPDKDNILPICDDEYFDDDILGRFVAFIRVVYGVETLEENLKFIADALGGRGTPREVIRNYFLNDFYKDHCKIYKKRPIYWLFDSGKKNGFKSLVYLHRYQSDLLAKLRTDYVHEQQERYRTQLSHIATALNTATGSERAKLLKQQDKLTEQLKEITAFEEKVHHLADQNIEIDLDDGVKKNYEIFTDVLAKI